MFASAAHSAAPRNPVGAYTQVHVSTGVDGASTHGLVRMLYDGALDAIAQARGAIRSGDIERKGRAIGRAARIVDEGLNAPLNLADGGVLASDLRALYNYLTSRLIHANLHNDDAALQECSRLIEPLRSAWCDIAAQSGA
jgi:flagellar protein FliS